MVQEELGYVHAHHAPALSRTQHPTFALTHNHDNRGQIWRVDSITIPLTSSSCINPTFLLLKARTVTLKTRPSPLPWSTSEEKGRSRWSWARAALNRLGLLTLDGAVSLPRAAGGSRPLPSRTVAFRRGRETWNIQRTRFMRPS